MADVECEMNSIDDDQLATTTVPSSVNPVDQQSTYTLLQLASISSNDCASEWSITTDEAASCNADRSTLYSRLLEIIILADAT